jgi:hypothetical protein
MEQEELEPAVIDRISRLLLFTPHEGALHVRRWAPNITLLALVASKKGD